jgi:outer membrane protein OmpA-like peptidoglycan-associated protein
MISRPSIRTITVVSPLVAALLVGCASKKFVRERFDEQAEHIQGVESAVEDGQRRIREVDERVGTVDSKAARAQQTGDEALQAGTRAFAVAEDAQRLARGTLVLETTIQDDVSRFSIDRWDLPQGAAATLESLVKQVMAMGRRVYLEIQGHTDSTGSEPWNLELGERRAEAVRRYLNGLGVPLYAMSVISYGSSEPAADNSTRDGRAQNRRTVVRVLDSTGGALSQALSPPAGSP